MEEDSRKQALPLLASLLFDCLEGETSVLDKGGILDKTLQSVIVSDARGKLAGTKSWSTNLLIRLFFTIQAH